MYADNVREKLPRYHQHSCRICGKLATKDEPMSARGKCNPCAVERIETNAMQLAEHRGPFFDHWLERLRASVGVSLDEPPREP